MTVIRSLKCNSCEVVVPEPKAHGWKSIEYSYKGSYEPVAISENTDGGIHLCPNCDIKFIKKEE